MAESRTVGKEMMRMNAKASTAAAVAATVLLMVCVAPAGAAEPIQSFNVYTTNTQAGAHPDLEATIVLGNPGAPEVAQDVAVNLPKGVFGNPNAATKCSSDDFSLQQCPSTAQVGVITIRANYGGDPNKLLGTAPVYDMESRSSEETARFAFIVPTVNIPINIPIEVRTSDDYGLRLTVTGITQEIPLAAANIAIWGFPEGAEHDGERFAKGSPGLPAGCPGQATPNCASNNGVIPHPTGLQDVPLIDNPTVCNGQPLTVKLDLTSYQDPTHKSHAESSYEPTTGCYNESFDPSLNVALTSDRTDSASGLEMRLRTKQFLNLSNAPSTIRSATVILPEGVTINPDAADGQQACLNIQVRFESEGPAECPDQAKIGNFEIGTPALDAPLTGSLYFGEPMPGNQYRVFMVASGFGIHAKLVSSVVPDPATGQLRISVNDLPEVPIEEFNLHLFASDRGLVATPTHCRVITADSLFIPWNSSLAPQRSEPIMSLTHGSNGGPCPGLTRPFKPNLVAGMSNPIAGAFSSFYLKLDREDGDQFLGDLNFSMPPGFTGDLRGITYCPEAAIAGAAQNPGRVEQTSPSCPSSSQIGTTNVAAGPGAHPFHAAGKMYLAGPFKGAPLSLAAITPAIAGPYDYGTQVVRVALHVDSLDAHVKAISDTVPSIIGGVPIRMRTIQVNIDKPEFTINPTNCSPMSINSQGIGDQGTAADFSSYFHAVNCLSLPFKPKMTVRQIGKKGTRRATNPQMQFDLRTRTGDANIKSLSVTLSSAFEIDQRHLGNICSEKELAATQCAGRTPIGEATTTTPLLDQPLSGPVYAVSGSGGLPRLAFILNGQVNLVPRADTETVKGGRLQTTVPVIPDAPIGHFHLTVFGGKTGYLINTRNICTHTPVTRVAYTGQNGKTRSESIKLKAACGKKHPRAKRHQR